jgi:formate dehydrogenase alpha subunit
MAGTNWLADSMDETDLADIMVTLTIDGKQVMVEEGTTILKAAESIGIEIPTFCYHDKLEAVGACRMCMVEVEKMWKLQVACATTVTDGMVVRTNTPKVQAARKGVLEFLLINHPLDCPVCDKGGECELQNLVFKYGSDTSRYKEEKRRFIVDPKSKYDDLSIGPQIVRNMNRCILCRKCVRFLNEIAGETDLGTFGRASKSEINILPDIPVDNPYSANTVEICPVGALTSKSFRYKVRVWELKATPSICSICGDGCNIRIWSKDEKIYRITSRRNDEVDEGFLCDRGRFGFDFVNHPDRLKQPLTRKGVEFSPVEWEEALKLIATKLKKAKNQYGPDSLAGIGSPRLTNEDNYLFQKFCRVVLGSNNIDHRVSSKHTLPSPDLGKHHHLLGMTNSISDLEKAKLLFVFGCDLEKEHPIINLRVIKSFRNGNNLILANPASTSLNRFNRDELVYKKGSEGALLDSLLYELGNTDQGSAYSDKTTGIPTEKIKILAQNLKESESLMVLCGKEITGHPDGAELIGKLNDLLHLTGHQGKEHCGVNILWADCNSQGALDCGVLPDRLPGYVDLSDEASRRRVEKVWQSEVPYKAGLDFRRILEAAHQGKIKAVYIMGADPVNEYPDNDYVKKALQKLDFLVVQDISLTETAKLAHVVLPGTSFAEKDGTFTNVERRVQRMHKAFDPFGNCKSDWYIICMLAQMMGYDFNYTSSAQGFNEMVMVSPVYLGLSWEELGETGRQWKVV